MSEKKVRARIAPSPTGEVHIGTIWIALFGWVFARQHGGSFILRIEDTDRERLVPGSVDRIYEALEWYGLTPDEGPLQGGPYGPYIQSERLPLYREHALRLIGQKSAYYCFCTPERLEQLRAAQTAAKQAPRYDKLCASLPSDETKRRIETGEPFVIRLNVPAQGTIEIDDIIRGRVTFALNQIDDSVLLKSDGWPTYHLAVVVDDHLMQISHIIRAEEWLPSVPKHLLLYRAFGWALPKFAHMPMILGTDRQKLSKRHGAASALAFRDQGYLPEAMKNFLVLMGWRPKGDEEIFDMDVVRKEFKLEDVNRAGAIFDRVKLDWMNGMYIRRLPPGELLERLGPWWHIPAGEQPSPEWKLAALALVRERMKKLSEIDELINFIFPSIWNEEVKGFDRSLLIPKQGSSEAVRPALAWAADWLKEVNEPWAADRLKQTMIEDIRGAGMQNNAVLWPVRVALTLRRASPDVFDLLTLLGKAESLRRITAFR